MKIFNYYLSRYPSLKQFIKFCIVGSLSAVLNFIVLYIFTEWLNIWYLASAVWGFIVSALLNFIANKYWTFGNLVRGKKALDQLLKFMVIAVSGLTLNTAIIYTITEFGRLDYRLSWLFATSIIAFWNYNLNRLWTFKHHG